MYDRRNYNAKYQRMFASPHKFNHSFDTFCDNQIYSFLTRFTRFLYSWTNCSYSNAFYVFFWSTIWPLIYHLYLYLLQTHGLFLSLFLTLSHSFSLPASLQSSTKVCSIFDKSIIPNDFSDIYKLHVSYYIHIPDDTVNFKSIFINFFFFSEL